MHDVSMGNYNSSWRQSSTRGRRAGNLLGTPRYGEVFLKVVWRGVGPTPLKPESQWIPSTPNRQTNFLLISQKGLAENLASAPPPRKRTRKAWQKFGQGFRVPLREGSPKGSYFASAVAETSHSGALFMKAGTRGLHTPLGECLVLHGPSGMLRTFHGRSSTV